MAAPATTTQKHGKRLRFGNLPRLPKCIEVPYAKCRAELDDDPAALVEALTAKPAYERVMGRLLTALTLPARALAGRPRCIRPASSRRPCSGAGSTG